MSSNITYLKSVFTNEDYKDFMETTSGHYDQIEKIGVEPITNYQHYLIGEENMETLICLYKNVKWYLEQQAFFTPKIQEGIAIVASKVAIMDNTCPKPTIDTYFKLGDSHLGTYVCNPFEEITRLLLNAANEEYEYSEPDRTYETLSMKKLNFQYKSYISVVQKALNGYQLYKESECYAGSYENVIDVIGKNLENSSIDTEHPSLAYLNENKSVLLSSIDKTREFYTSKLDVKEILGQMPVNIFRSKLEGGFDNRCYYVRKNIGIQEKTKMIR